jgi:hypothetical protein
VLDQMLRRFGQISVWLGLCPPEGVAAAVEQEDAEIPIGQRLEAMGLLAPGKTERVLAAQRLAAAHPAAQRHTLDIDLDLSDPELPVVEFHGVIDGRTRLLLPDERDGVRWDAPLTVSLAEVEYINRAGVEDLTNLWGDRPFVVCEVPEVFLLLLEEVGADVLMPLAGTRREGRRLAREHASAFAEVVSAARQSEEPATRELPVRREEEARLEIAFRIEGDIGVFVFQGVLAPSTALARRREIRGIVEARPCEALVVDLTRLAECQHDGLVFLGDLPEGVEVYLAAPEHLRQHLALVGATERYSVSASQEEALAAARKPYVGVRDRPVYHRRGCWALRATSVKRRIPLGADEIADRRPCGICIGGP